MRYFLLFVIILTTGVSHGNAQINPIQNLDFQQSYTFGWLPYNKMYMNWDEPQIPHDSLVGYKVYRDDSLYQFQTETYVINWEIDPHSFDPIPGGNAPDFLFFKDEQPFWAHVTAIYEIEGRRVESAYIDSVFTEGPAIWVRPNTQENLKIYPNPTLGVVYLPKRIKNCQVYSMNGRLIKKVKNKEEVDISGQPSGIYFFQLTMNTNRQIIKKVVLK